MKDFCKTNSILQVHGAPRTPTTQGLVERGNRTFKENLSNILREKKAELNSWCSVLGEAAYKEKHNHTCCNQTNSIRCSLWDKTMEGSKEQWFVNRG